MDKIVRTIERYPGTVMDTLRIYDSIAIVNLCKEGNLVPDNTTTSDYGKFYDEYINNGSRLEDIPEITGIPESTVSAWASDFIGTLFIHLENNSETEPDSENEQDSTKSYFYEGTSPIYKRASEMDADYYEMSTGRIYHIQEYNRAKKFGLPSQGIRVSVDGHTIGYAQ